MATQQNLIELRNSYLDLELVKKEKDHYNKQLAEKIEELHEEIGALKQQHAAETCHFKEKIRAFEELEAHRFSLMNTPPVHTPHHYHHSGATNFTDSIPFNLPAQQNCL